MVTRALHTFIIGLIATLLAACDPTIHFYPQDPQYPGGPGSPDDPGVNPPATGGNIRINVDWSRYGKEVPTGMTMHTQHTETREHLVHIDNNIDCIYPKLAEGRHWATVFNYTTDEFKYVRFRGLDAIETAEAFAPAHSGSSWYSPKNIQGNYLAAEPEWLAVDTIMTDVVDYSLAAVAQSPLVIGTLHPENIIYTLHITMRSENISNIIAARGAISGMACGRFLAADCPNDNKVTVTHLIESDAWSRSRSGIGNDAGTVKCELLCFGLPSNHRGTDNENHLEFNAMLADGKTVVKYDIPVGHLIKEPERPERQRGDNLHLYLELELDPQLPPPGPDDPSGDWGFDVWVNDWEEGDDQNISFG